MKNTKKLGEKLFTFAVIADSHLNQDEAECNSPFDVNKLANRRMRYVIEDINCQDIDFVLHLGDLIHPVPAVEGLYLQAAEKFNAQRDALNKPMYLVPGNHDIGDKPMKWAPAGSITADYITLWRKNFGADYYSFSKDNCHFITLNAQLYNSGLAEEVEQEKWLEEELKNNQDKRVFVSLHYPPFLHNEMEEEHYDNIAEPARAKLLELFSTYGVECLFAGHVHNFWFLQKEQMSCYLLPSTAFVRQDYSEMLQAPPVDPELEAGRNDFAKLGYFLVHIYENDHVVQMVRTNGEQRLEEDVVKTEKARLNLVAPKQSQLAPLGFDLRSNWAEAHGIAPGGGLDEFDRKLVRNDYPLLALTEMGVKKLRIPFQDLRNNDGLARIADYIRLGHEFTLFSYGLPSSEDKELVAKHQNLLVAWEITARLGELDNQAADFNKFFQESPVPVFVGKMWEHGDDHDSDKPYYHVINHGFIPSDEQIIADIFANLDVKPGLVFRLSKDDSATEFTTAIMQIASKHNVGASLHIRLAGANPAEPTNDDVFVTNRLTECVLASLVHPALSVYSDTLVDVDRGYFARRGVLDELCNPRVACRVLSHLNAVIEAEFGTERPDRVEKRTEHGIDWVFLYKKESIIAVCLPLVDGHKIFKLPAKLENNVESVVDLFTGRIYLGKEVFNSENIILCPRNPIVVSVEL